MVTVFANGIPSTAAVVDTTPPDTAITGSPASPTDSTGATIPFTGGDDVTPAGSLTFEGRLDGASFAAVTSPVVLTGLALGSYTYEVRAKDAANNVDATPASVTWTVVPPVEIAVEQQAGSALTDNASMIPFGLSPIGVAAAAKTFTVRNLGGVPLTGLAATSNGAEFAVNTAGFPASLAAGASATFTVTFTPAVSGARTATLSIASSDADENPFEVALTGQGLAFTADTDSDGLNDAS